MTARRSILRFSNSLRLVSCAQIDEKAGHLRELQRRTFPGNRTAAAGATMPDPMIPSLELAVPRGGLAHASPALSAASAAARPCGVNPLRGFPSLRSVTPQRRPARARLRGQATPIGSVVSEGSGQHIEQRRRGRDGSNCSFRSIPGHVSLSAGQDEWYWTTPDRRLIQTTRPVTPLPTRLRARQRPRA